MSYCIECNSRNGHVFGCPEDDGQDDYIEDDDYDGDEQDEDVPDYDVEWDGRSLRCVRN